MAGANPNPAYITAAMWWLWDYVDNDPQYGGVRLGGIYANKPGNHNTVNANLANWPDNYSVRNPIDRREPKTKARAIDYTMNAAGMRLMTGRMLDGANRNDPRMRCVKEFYGSLDGVHVVGRIKDDEDGPWRSASSDSSHTWHEHDGILTPYVDDMEAMRGLASLKSGESLDDYLAGTTARVPEPTLRENDEGWPVGLLQRALNAALGLDLVVDEDYGPATTAGVRELQRRAGITENGIYGDDSADALRSLLEDDMSWDEKIDLITGQGVSYSGSEWPASFLLASNHYYTLLRTQEILAEQKASRLREEAILAAVKGLDTKAVIAAVNTAAAADAERAAVVLAEVQELASGGATAQEIVDQLALRLAGGE